MNPAKSIQPITLQSRRDIWRRDVLLDPAFFDGTLNVIATLVANETFFGSPNSALGCRF